MKCKIPKNTQNKSLLSDLTQCFKCGTYFSKKYSDPYCGVYVFCPQCKEQITGIKGQRSPPKDDCFEFDLKNI